MSGSRGSEFNSRWLLANFPFPVNIRFQLKKVFKCRENGIDRLRKGKSSQLLEIFHMLFPVLLMNIHTHTEAFNTRPEVTELIETEEFSPKH